MYTYSINSKIIIFNIAMLYIKDDEDDTETAPEQINKVESAVDITEKFVYEQLKNPRSIFQSCYLLFSEIK